MPIYEYRCLKCGHQFEKLQNITDHPVRRCEKCKEGVTRVYHPVAIHFKGSGFYSTDYGKKGKPREATGQKPADKEKKSGKETTSTKSE